jgi:hypothetical protein
MFDGITGLVTQPLSGAKQDGASGFIKGLGKGFAGLVVKPGAGIYGLPGYAMKGIYKEIQKHFGASANNYIIAARTAQGWEAWLQTDKDAQTEIVHRYLQIVELVKNKEKKGGKEDQVEAVQEFIEKRKQKRRKAWEKLAKSVKEKKGTLTTNLTPHGHSTSSVHKEASHSTSDLPRIDFGGRRESSPAPHEERAAASTGHLPHAATFPVAKPHYHDDSSDEEGESQHDHDLHEAIRQSVMQSSTGDHEEDELIDRAIRASIAELQRGKGPTTLSRTEMGDTADEEEQLKRAIEESMRTVRATQGGDHHHEGEGESSSSTRIEMRDFEDDTETIGSGSTNFLPPAYEAPPIPPRSPARGSFADLDAKTLPPGYGNQHDSTSLSCPAPTKAKVVGAGPSVSSSSGAPAAGELGEHIDDEAELKKALEESQQLDEVSKKERTEEEIVLEYVKKQSLLEEEHRRRITQGKETGQGGSSSTSGAN